MFILQNGFCYPFAHFNDLIPVLENEYHYDK